LELELELGMESGLSVWSDQQIPMGDEARQTNNLKCQLNILFGSREKNTATLYTLSNKKQGNLFDFTLTVNAFIYIYF